jgi:hypothetical protein
LRGFFVASSAATGLTALAAITLDERYELRLVISRIAVRPSRPQQNRNHTGQVPAVIRYDH